MAKITQSVMVLLAIFGLSGCDQAYTATPSMNDTPSVDQPKPLPQGLVYCSEANPETFNPQLTTSGTSIDASSKQLYNRLLEFDGQQLIAGLATAWQISADGLRVQFELQQNVSFHHTEQFQPTRFFNADDVVFSFERILNPAHPYHRIGGGQYPYFDSVGFREVVKKVRKLDEHHVEFVLHIPSPHILADLSADFAVIHSAEYAAQLLSQDQAARLDQQPIGTGPFKLSAFVPHSFIRYHRHDQYWRGAVALPKLLFEISPSPTTRLIKLIGGDCDVAVLPQSSELEILQHHTQLEITSQPDLNIAFWAFNTNQPKLNDPVVRNALALAVNRERILTAIYNNMAQPSDGILPPGSWLNSRRSSVTTRNQGYDPAQAKALLKQANAEDLELSVWALPSERRYNPNSIKTAQLIQQDLAQIGVTLHIHNDEPIAFRPKLQRGDYDSVLIGWTADTNDPDNFYSPLLSCNGIRAGTNFSQWCDAKFDRLILAARQAITEQERGDLYQMLDQYMQQQRPLLPFAHADRVIGHHQQWQGVLLPIVGGIDFSTVSKRQ